MTTTMVPGGDTLKIPEGVYLTVGRRIAVVGCKSCGAEAVLDRVRDRRVLLMVARRMAAHRCKG